MGIPQCSIIGPLLFTIFINDLPDSIKHSTIDMYADDTIMYHSSSSPHTIENKLNQDLSHIHNWLKQNKLIMNCKKTSSMLIGTHQKLKQHNTIHLKVIGTPISQTLKHKHLGIHIDPNLNFSTHINHLRSKLGYRMQSPY